MKIISRTRKRGILRNGRRTSLTRRVVIPVFATVASAQLRGAAILLCLMSCLFVCVSLEAQEFSRFDAPPRDDSNWSAQPERTQSAPVSQSWPQTPVTFDSQISPASFEPSAETSNAPKESASIESMIDSAGPMLSDFKNSVVNKAGGLLGMVTGKSGSGSSPNVPKMLSSLAIVLGVYFAFVWVMRKLSPNGNAKLPNEVVHILGRTPFGPRQTLQLVRLGSKLVLLLNGPEGTHPIGEITDPAEVEHLSNMCRGGKSTSVSRSFNSAAVNHASHASQGSANALLNNEQVTQSLTNVLRTLENAARQPKRNIFEA